MTAGAPLPPARRICETLAISVAGGVLLWLTTRSGLALFTGLAYAILLIPAVVERYKAPVLGYLPGFMLFVMLSHQPLSKFGWWVPYIFPELLMWSYFLQAVFAATLRRHTRLPAWVILPIAVAAGEWTHRFLDPGDYAMYKVGTGLARWPVLIQLADVVGVFGLSLLVMIIWSLPVEFLRGRISPSQAASSKSLRQAIVAAAVVAILLPTYGLIRLATVDSVEGPRVAIIQPSLDHTRETTPLVVEEQKKMTAGWIPPGSADLIAWPENAILAPYGVESEYHEIISWLARSRQAPMLIGAQGFGPEGRRPTNTAFLIGEDGTILDHYDKVVLFPFTERRVFPALERLWPWLSDRIVALTLQAWREAPDGWSPTTPSVLQGEIGGTEQTFWTPVCYEIFFPRLGRQARRQGATFFVNLTSEGWLGWSASRDMMGAAILRAVENRVGFVRVANTGVSAFIGPDGRVDSVLRGRRGRMHLDEGHLTARVRLPTGGPTIYSRIGGVIDPLPFVVWLLLAGAGIVRKRSTTRSHE